MLTSKTILFICPHGGGKSALAATMFNLKMGEQNLPYNGDFAGLEPYKVLPQPVIEYLTREGIDLADHEPRRVTQADLDDAHQVITIGCSLDEFEVDPGKLTLWTDVPDLSDGFDTAVSAIHQKVKQLVATIE